MEAARAPGLQAWMLGVNDEDGEVGPGRLVGAWGTPLQALGMSGGMTQGAQEGESAAASIDGL